MQYRRRRQSVPLATGMHRFPLRTQKGSQQHMGSSAFSAERTLAEWLEGVNRDASQGPTHNAGVVHGQQLCQSTTGLSFPSREHCHLRDGGLSEGIWLLATELAGT